VIWTKLKAFVIFVAEVIGGNTEAL